MVQGRWCLLLSMVIAAAFLATRPPRAAAEDNQSAAPQVKQLVTDVSDAIVKVDTARVDELWTPDFIYIHSSGAQQTKTQFLDDVKTGRRKYYSIAPGDMQVRFYGSTAIVIGVTDMKLSAAGRDLDLKLRFTAVCIEQSGKWRMASWQSTPIPPPAAR